MNLERPIAQAKKQQLAWSHAPRAVREELLQRYAAAIKNDRVTLATILAEDAKKTLKDAQSEVDASADILLKTINDTRLGELMDMQRERARPPVGLVALITSFNFPMVVAHWTIAPALLAGNAVLWKPSEKTPAAARACKALFDTIAGEYAGLLQLVEGGREAGAALVAHESVDLISATGSVAMGEAIAHTIAHKNNKGAPPILELGGNNAAIISQHCSKEHLAFAVTAILTSYLATTGQRCTNTRRLFVHRSWYDDAVALFSARLKEFIDTGYMRDPDNSYGYRELVDDDARARFEAAKKQAVHEGGKILFGGANEPALALLNEQSLVMHTETFAPLLYIVPYDGDIKQAMAMVNAPANAGLVNGLYTLSREEAEYFAAHNQAGHSVINSPKGTGTPAFGMGFGGNKSSGSGEILWGADPLAAFTKPGPYRRVAINKNIPLV